MDYVSIWNGVLEKESREGVASLRPEEATIFHVNRFICEFAIGGLSGFLYNISPDWHSLDHLEAEARKIGCDAVADRIADIARVFRRPVSAETESESETWAVHLKRLDPEDTLISLEAGLDGADGVLWDALERFTIKRYERG